MSIWDMMSSAGRGLSAFAPLAAQMVGNRFGGPLGGAFGSTLGGMVSNYFNQPRQSQAPQAPSQPQAPSSSAGASQQQMGSQQPIGQQGANSGGMPGLQNLTYNNLPQMGSYAGQQFAQNNVNVPFLAPYLSGFAGRMGQHAGTGLQSMLSPFMPNSMRDVSLGDLGYGAGQAENPFASSLSSMMGQLRGNLPVSFRNQRGFGSYAGGGEVHGHFAPGGYSMEGNYPQKMANPFGSHMVTHPMHTMNPRSLSEMFPH